MKYKVPCTPVTVVELIVTAEIAPFFFCTLQMQTCAEFLENYSLSRTECPCSYAYEHMKGNPQCHLPQYGMTIGYAAGAEEKKYF